MESITRKQALEISQDILTTAEQERLDAATYDSRDDTQKHIDAVSVLITSFIDELVERELSHDATKLEPPEKPIFDEYTPKLRDTTYGSDEYKRYLAEMKVALDHHYAHNAHHAEHHPNGIDGMTLVDLVEMLCDWYAATQRHADGDILKSLEINRERFGISEQLHRVLLNTVEAMGWANSG